MPSSSFAALKENMAEHRSHQLDSFLLYLTSIFRRRRSLGRLFLPFQFYFPAFVPENQNLVNRSIIMARSYSYLTRFSSCLVWSWDAHRFAKQFEPALAAYSTCTRIDPEYYDCWNNFGITYAEMGNTAKASAVWYKVLQINPTYCKAHTNLGLLAYQQQNWEDAIVAFRSTLVQCPRNVIAHYGLGLIYYRPRFDKEKAIFHLDQVLIITPRFDYASDAREKLLELTW